MLAYTEELLIIHKSNKSFIPRGWVYFLRTIQEPKVTDCYEEQTFQVLLQWGQERGCRVVSKPPQHSPRVEPSLPSLLRVIWAPLTHMFGVSDVRRSLRADQWQLLLSQRIGHWFTTRYRATKQAPMEEYTLPCFEKKKELCHWSMVITQVHWIRAKTA